MNRQPYIGLIVHYFPKKSEIKDTTASAAIVTNFHGGGPELPLINVTVVPDQGNAIKKTSLQHESAAADDQPCWRYVDEQ